MEMKLKSSHICMYIFNYENNLLVTVKIMTNHHIFFFVQLEASSAFVEKSQFNVSFNFMTWFPWLWDLTNNINIKKKKHFIYLFI